MHKPFIRPTAAGTGHSDLRVGLSPDQCRAARALLEWSQSKLAELTGISDVTIRSFESGRRIPTSYLLDTIQRSFEAQGIVFPYVIREGKRIACGVLTTDAIENDKLKIKI